MTQDELIHLMADAAHCNPKAYEAICESDLSGEDFLAALLQLIAKKRPA